MKIPLTLLQRMNMALTLGNSFTTCAQARTSWHESRPALPAIHEKILESQLAMTWSWVFENFSRNAPLLWVMARVSFAVPET